MKKAASPSQEKLNQEKLNQNDVNKGGLPAILVGAIWIAVTLLICQNFVRDQSDQAQISNHGRTVPAKILKVVATPGEGESQTVFYAFTLPSGQRKVDAVQAEPQKVYEMLGIGYSSSSGEKYVPSQHVGASFPPATVRYVPGKPSRHRLQGFRESPLPGYLFWGVVLAMGCACLGVGLHIWQAGRLPGLRYREQGQCFVLMLAPYTVMQYLWPGLAASLACLLAFLGANEIQTSWLAWHGIAVAGETWVGNTWSIGLVGAGMVLLGLGSAGYILRIAGERLYFRTRPCVLDRGRGEFRVGARVVCGLGDIARLHLRRGHNPDAPENLADARYFASFVLRDGRQVPFGLSFRTFYYRKLPETELGDGIAGAQIEAVMQAAAAFLGIEYVLTRGADARLRNSGDC